MKRRLLAILLSLTLMLSLVPTAWAKGTESGGQPILQSDEVQSTEGNDADAQAKLTAAGGNLASGTYKLSENITLTNAITIPADAEVTIDLNGYTLTGTGNDSVIVVLGELTVKDSSGNNSGKITGGIGHKSDYGNGGGAISIENGGKCTLKGGTLTGNKCNSYNYNAGGVYAKGSAKFYMTGGVITGNTANRQGGGIFGGGSSTIEISGGEISNNTAQFGGGVCYNGTMTMTGGTIKNNTAQYSGEVGGQSWPNIMGGGIKVNSSSPLEFYGGEVSGNKAISSNGITALGAGIYGGDIKVKGNVKVYDNKRDRDNVDENIYLDGSAMLEVVGDLNSSAQLPVTRATQTGRVTSSNGYSFDGIITADDSALTLETRNGDLYFTKTVDPNKVICTMQVGGKPLGYDSLSAALADLPSDDNVITLLKSIDLGAQVSVPANSGAATITTDASEDVVITWENATTSFFNVPSGAELTVSGNIVICGRERNGQRAFDVAGTLNFGKENSESEYPKVEQFDLSTEKGIAAVYVNGGTLNLYSGTLSQNKGYYGGAVSVRYKGNANLFGGTISGNTAPSGGGLYVANSTVTLSGTKISENIAQKGGGVYNQNGTVTIEQGEISGNWVDGEIPNGGGIYSDGTVTMNGGKINENAVKVNVNKYGRGRGAAVCNNGKFTITAGEVSGNYCEQGNDVTGVTKEQTMYCAGLYNEKEMYIEGGTVSDNYYKFSDVANNPKCFQGVGVSNNGGTLTISGGTITGNGIHTGDSSGRDIAGAGVASTANSTYNAVFNMTGGTITGNHGGNGSGAGLYLENSGDHTSTATISGGSIVGNTGASGVYAARANLSISGNPVISGQKTNLYLGTNKITLSGPLTNGASIGVTANTPTEGKPVQITTTETGTDYYKDAAQYFIPDAANVVAQANEGKYVELAHTTDTYHKVTLNLSHASVSIGSPTTMVKSGESCTITIKADKGYTLPVEAPSEAANYKCDNDKTTANVTVKPTENTTITIEAVANRYKVEFNGNGNTSETMAAQDMIYGDAANLTKNAFVRTGYNFAGWSTTPDGKCEYPDEASVKNLTAENGGTVTLYAVWTEKKVIPAFSSSAIQSYKYDGSNKAYNLTSNIEGFVITYKQGEAGVDKPTNVGTYDVIISRAEDATYAAFSQTINGGLVITKVSSSSSSSNPTYSVTTPSKSENGGVAVSSKNARKGDTVTVTVTPDAGYQLDKLTVTDKNGNVLKLTDKGDGKYSFTMPDGKVEVKAVFAKKVETSPFDDVSADAYYNKAVQWAQEKGITDGISSNLFGPKQPCTRAQIVTFLWRAAGSPEPKGTAAGMTDVVPGSYYAKAVAWAVENGITTGTAEGTFSPDATCTRAQAVTFLARAQKATATGKTAFSDVPADSYFADAVAWAQANGVTTGTSETTFSPDNDCTRAQIVTFLYRANQGT
mgnify:CR=1 FL=1